MKIQLLALLASGLLGGLAIVESTTDDWSEPDREMILVFDGVEHDFVLGEPLELTTGDHSHRLTVNAKESRYFNKGGIRLRYPADFFYEFDDEIDGCDVYSVEGPETLIMVQVYDEPLDLADVVELTVEAVMEQLESFEVVTLKHKVKLGGHTFDSTQLRIYIDDGDLAFTQDYFAFGCKLTEEGDMGTGVLCIQYGYDDDEAMSAESAAARRMLKSSFDFDAPE